MRPYKLLLWVMFALSIVACTGARKLDVAYCEPDQLYLPIVKKASDVSIYFGEPQYDYKAIGFITLSSSRGFIDWSRILQRKAAEMGGNGLILIRKIHLFQIINQVAVVIRK